MAEPTQAKAALRHELRERRAARTDEERAAASAGLSAHAGTIAAAARTVAAFVGTGTEPPTLPLLDALAVAGVRVLLPVLLEDADLDWAEYPAPLAPARFGLLEPAGPRLGPDAVATAELVLAPALAVDRAGRRLGQGGGSYDRALTRARAPVVAVLYDDEVLDAVPVEPHDRLVSGVLTPQAGLHRFV